MTVFIDAAYKFTVQVKLEKVGGGYIILNSDEWIELQTKKTDIDEACFGHPKKTAGEIDVLETPKHSNFMKNLYGQKCVFLKQHQPCCFLSKYSQNLRIQDGVAGRYLEIFAACVGMYRRCCHPKASLVPSSQAIL